MKSQQPFMKSMGKVSLNMGYTKRRSISTETYSAYCVLVLLKAKVGIPMFYLYTVALKYLHVVKMLLPSLEHSWHCLSCTPKYLLHFCLKIVSKVLNNN